jgi:hypothetical protein
LVQVSARRVPRGVAPAVGSLFAVAERLLFEFKVTRRF